MSLLNLFKKKPKFKVGDTVKCIDDRNWNGPATDIKLIFGKTYKILDITYTSCCNEMCLDIGGRFVDTKQFTVCGVGKCKHIEIQGMGVHWASSKRFALHTGAEEEEKEEALDKEKLKKKLEKAIAIEDYQKATKLRDLINH